MGGREGGRERRREGGREGEEGEGEGGREGEKERRREGGREGEEGEREREGWREGEGEFDNNYSAQYVIVFRALLFSMATHNSQLSSSCIYSTQNKNMPITLIPR